jgi:proteic killer suppression protein
VIKSFAEDQTEALFAGHRPKRLPPSLHRQALKKLLLIHGASSLKDLTVPPGNRLEKLRGDRAGQHSVRINDQWRICFVWRDGDAYEVEVTDYHS